MSVAERDLMEFLLTGVEILTNTINRCRIYEILYLDDTQYQQTESPMRPAFDHLSAALISLYAAVLRFLAKAYRAFSKSGFHRARDATFNPGMFEGLLEQARLLDLDVIAAVGNCKEAYNRNAHRKAGRLFEILKDLEEPAQRIDSGVKTLSQNVGTKRRTETLQWISAIPYEDNHNTAAMGHTSGTGEWLLQHGTYVKWRTSRTCNVLWLYGIRKNLVSPFYAMSESVVLMILHQPVLGKPNLSPQLWAPCGRALVKSLKKKHLPTFTAIETRQTAKVRSRS